LRSFPSFVPTHISNLSPPPFSSTGASKAIHSFGHTTRNLLPFLDVTSTSQQEQQHQQQQHQLQRLRHPQPLNRTLFIHHLPRERVRSPPAQFDALARAALDALHADRLRDAVLLRGAQGAAGLRVEFEGVALFLFVALVKKKTLKIIFGWREGLRRLMGWDGMGWFQHTFVTASWKVRSSMGFVVEFEIREEIISSVLLGRVTAKMVLMALLVIVRFWGASGRAELKVHSSSWLLLLLAAGVGG
jgi:hypothetical protein